MRVGRISQVGLARLAGVFVACAAAQSAACGSSSPSAPPAAKQPSPASAPLPGGGAVAETAGSAESAESAGSRCEILPFAKTNPVAEASGAAFLAPFAADQIAVVSDSGNNGAFVVIDANSGVTLEAGLLPLGDGASDDLEGLSMHGDKLVAITSSGWIRAWAWQPDAKAKQSGRFRLVDGPYPIDHVNDACPGTGINCGRNYEGLCLRHGATPAGACAGFAAAKKTGELICLVARQGRLVLDPSRAIAVAGKQALADCSIASDDGSLWAGNNAFGGFAVYRIRDWDLRQGAKPPEVERMGALGAGFPEAILVGAKTEAGNLVYRFSDTSNAPSQQWKFQCR